jgi:outer membrane protein assembly factor BamB
VLWGSTPKPTTYVSPTQLTAEISAADLASAGNVDVKVANQSDGSASSNSVPFTVRPIGPFAFNSISPKTVHAGGSAFALTAFGGGFTAASVVTWNGTSLPTTYVSDTTLRASVTAAQIANTGSAAISVQNPPALGGTAPPLSLTIDPPSIDAVSYQINPEHTGAVTFRSVSFPASSLWSVNVGGPASYALIVGGRVFVTVSVNGNSQLLALDAVTGTTLWGPIAFSGTANATYDAGILFVVSSSGILSQIISALDPATGNPKWSATVGGGWYPAPPVAADGVVYALNGGLVTAFDEATGATLWQRGVSGTSGTVAVSVDGVYASAPCTTFALQPVTGAVIWMNNTGCSGGGGSTPIVADGVLYSPIDGMYSGTVFGAETGSLLGNFSASYLPAFTHTNGFFLKNSTLQGIASSNNQILWSFAGDGALVTSPIAVNNYVIVGSSNGNIYALDAATGSQVWTQSLGGTIQANSNGIIAIYTGLAAGAGLLVVPSGNNVTAFVLSANP